MPTIGDVDKLAARLRQQAKAEADRIIDLARKAGERDLQKAKSELEAAKQEAEAGIRARTESRLRAANSAILLREKRLVLQAQEDAISQVMDAALEDLARSQDKAGRTAVLKRMVAEARAQLGCDNISIRANQVEHELLQDAISNDPALASVNLCPESLETAGGILATDESGRLVFDNTFEARMERRREELRNLAADILGLTALKEQE